MITVDYGDKIEASFEFDYSGPAGYFTFSLEIGTWIGPAGPFNTLDRWEIKDIYITPGHHDEIFAQFTIAEVSGLNRGDIYDMNWEIGRGSQDDDTWELIERKITDDIIKIAELAAEFANLTVTYTKV